MKKSKSSARIRPAFLAPGFLLGAAVSLVSVSLASGPAHRPAPDTIFQCVSTVEEWGARVHVSENGSAALEGRRGSTTFHCRLSIDDFEYEPKAEVPNVEFSFKLGECRSEKGAVFSDRHLLGSIAVRAFARTRRSWESSLQWITYLKPSACRIESANDDALSRNAEKRRKGLWPD
jgi:hypothetical protein